MSVAPLETHGEVSQAAACLESTEHGMNEKEEYIPGPRGTLSTNNSNQLRLWCSWPCWCSYTHDIWNYTPSQWSGGSQLPRFESRGKFF